MKTFIMVLLGIWLSCNQCNVHGEVVNQEQYEVCTGTMCVHEDGYIHFLEK